MAEDLANIGLPAASQAAPGEAPPAATGSSAIAGIGIPTIQPAQSPASATAQTPSEQFDLSGAVQDENGVYIKQGDKGDIFFIAPERLGKVAHLPGVRFATQQEVQARKDEKQVSESESGFTAALHEFGIGLTDAVSAAGRGTAALTSAGIGLGGSVANAAAEALDIGTPEARAAARASIKTGEQDLQNFARDAGGHALAKDIAYLTGGVEGENEFVRAYAAREKAFPMLTAVGRGAGLLVPAIATAGLAGAATGAATVGAEAATGGASLAARLATTILSPSGVAQTAAGGALSGVAGGAAAPFETMDDTPVSREAILWSGAMGGILGGVIGGVAGAAGKYAPGVLAKVFGKTSSAETRAIAEAEVKSALPEAIRNMAESPIPAERELFESISSRGAKAGKGVQDMADRIEQSIAKAGPNPEAKALAASEAVERELGRVKSTEKLIRPDEWRAKTLSPDDMVRNRDALKVGARNEITEHLSGVIDESDKVMEHLKSFELKAPLVRKNLADLTEEETTQAIGSSLGKVREMRSEFEKLFEGGEGAIRPSRSSESIGFSFNEAEEALKKAADGADAYVAMDKLRRGVNARLSALYSQTRSTLADDAFEGQKLFKFADTTYENTRQFLADPAIWKKQGELQLKVNQAWADDIASSGRVTKLGAFTSRDVSGRYGQMQARVDPDKIERYLDNLGKKTLPDQDLRAMIDTKISLMKEVGAAYEIPAGSLNKAIKSAEGLRDSVDAAQKLMTESGGLETWMTSILSSRMAKMSGNAVGGIVGGALGSVGGPAGTVAGALAGHSVGAAIEEYAAHRIPQVITKALRMTDTLGLGVNKLPDVYQKQLTRTALTSVPAGARALFALAKFAPRSEQIDAYEKRTDAIAKLAASPEAMAAHAAPQLSRFGTVQPTLPGTTQLAAHERVLRMINNWPGKQQAPSIVKTKAGSSVSDSDLKLSAAIWQATTKPMTMFDDFESGTLDPDKAKWTWIQYPQLQKLFQAAAIDALSNTPEDAQLSSNGLAQIDNLLGFDGALQPTLNRAFSARMDAVGAEQQKSSQAPPQGPPFENPSAKPTRVEKLMGQS